jgi:hypothetical protein
MAFGRIGTLPLKNDAVFGPAWVRGSRVRIDKGTGYGCGDRGVFREPLIRA